VAPEPPVLLLVLNVEITFSASSAPHAGHLTFLALELDKTSFSNLRPQARHTYSKIGIDLNLPQNTKPVRFSGVAACVLLAQATTPRPAWICHVPAPILMCPWFRLTINMQLW